MNLRTLPPSMLLALGGCANEEASIGLSAIGTSDAGKLPPDVAARLRIGRQAT